MGEMLGTEIRVLRKHKSAQVINIPKAIAGFMELKGGDMVSFTPCERGFVVIKRVDKPKIEDLIGRIA